MNLSSMLVFCICRVLFKGRPNLVPQVLQDVGKKSWETGPLATRRGGADGSQHYAHTLPGPNSVFQKLLGAIDKETGQPLSDMQIAATASILILAGDPCPAIMLNGCPCLLCLGLKQASMYRVADAAVLCAARLQLSI